MLTIPSEEPKNYLRSSSVLSQGMPLKKAQQIQVLSYFFYFLPINNTQLLLITIQQIQPFLFSISLIFKYQLNSNFYTFFKMIKDHQILAPSLSSTNSLLLPHQCQQAFKQINCPAFRANQLTSGIKLAKLVNAILYDGKNTILANQIISQNQQRKGNNVINMNMVLKQVRNNSKVQVPQHIYQLTTFKLIDNEQDMVDFVKWIINSSKSEKEMPGLKKSKQSYTQQSKQNLQKNAGNYVKLQKYQQKPKDQRNFHSRALQPYSNETDDKQSQPEEKDYQDYNEINSNNQNKEQNIFENVFFCDRDISPDKLQFQMNDSLQMSEKVSKKGSFKVFKPKTIFSDSQNGQKNTNMKDVDSPQKENQQKQTKSNAHGTQFQRYYSDEKQTSDRKTIPKMPERPPIYRKLNKEQTKTQSVTKNQKIQNFKDPSPFVMEQPDSNFSSHQRVVQKEEINRSQNISRNTQKQKNKKNRMENQNIFDQINNLDEQLKKQRSEVLKETKNTQNKSLNMWENNVQSTKRSRSNRKIFKIDIKEVGQNERKSIIQWLISINLLNSMATNYFERFHQICKNGVIFPEIINHHRGRSNQLYYFKNPTKSAQVHSNYQKVFSSLKQIPNFQSELLFMYDYFVPEALQNAFWSLLKSCQQCFQKIASQKTKVFNKQSAIKEKLKTKPDSQNISRFKAEQADATHSLKKPNAQDEYQRIKYGSKNKFKQIAIKSSSKVNKQIQSRNSAQKEQKNKRKSSLDFIKQLPQKQSESLKHQQLVQIQQPVELNKIMKGYKELHDLKKSHIFNSFINTPQKKNENSISRSRIVSTNSIKKGQEKPEPPSITLQMQMKALKYLKQKGHLNLASMQVVSLFDDTIRNGVLFNKIIIQQLKANYRYVQKPRNIVDCRENFKKGLAQLKQLFVMVPFSYQFYFEEIIKGEINIFYGLVWHIICANSNKISLNMGSNAFKNESAILNISKNYHNFDANQSEQFQQEILFWVRQLEQQNSQIASLQIRDINSLLINIVTNNFLYKLSSSILPQKYTLKPTYEHPLTQMEQQSNIKKILSFFSHNKILRSELVWKAKSIVKKEKSTTLQILKQLMNYYTNTNTKKSTLNVEKQNPVVSFIKFTRQNSREEIKTNERINQRLETTMANNSFSVPLKKQEKDKGTKKQIHPIQIPWMRSLGFTEDLSINNGVILCRLMSKLAMQSINYNESPVSKAECLTNIRKAVRLLDKFKWDEQDIASADEKTTMEIYKFIKQKFKHSYAMKTLS